MKPALRLDNSILKVRTEEVTKSVQYSYLKSPASAGGATLLVANINGAAINGYVIIGETGSEQTELLKIHASTAPTGFTITLSSNLVYDHPTDTPVYFIDYNQVEFSRSVTSGSAKTVLSTTTLMVDQEFTTFADTNTTGYGYSRFKNATTNAFSEYSDEGAYSAMVYNAIGKIIDRVMVKANEKDEFFVTRDEALDFIWDYIDHVNDLKTKWNHEEADQDISNATTIGGETFSLPSDIKYRSEKSIVSIRLEGREPLKYIGMVEFANMLMGASRTRLNGAVLLGATEIDLVDGANISDVGTGYIAGDEVAWTGKTLNQLTGCSGVLAHDSGAVFYQAGSLGTPEYYTIINGVGRLYPAPSSDQAGLTLVIDYYMRLTHPDSENDLLSLPYVSPCVDHCLMCVNEKRGKDGLLEASRYETKRDKKLVQIIKNERLNQDQYLTSLE